MNVWNRLQPIAIVEIVILFFLFYGLLSFIRGARGAGVLKVLFFLFALGFVGLFWVAETIRAYRLSLLLDRLLEVSLFGFLLIFWPEIRRGFVRLGQSPLLLPLFRGTSDRMIREIVMAASRMAKARIGALIAIPREVSLADYAESGATIDAEISSELLETIFYPGSALHDGAVIVQDDKVVAAGCLFPLTESAEVSKSMGTRHRAALGLTEESDAIAVIVSEETGRISVAVGGRLTTDVGAEGLETMLRELYLKPGAETRRREREAGAPAGGFRAGIPEA